MILLTVIELGLFILAVIIAIISLREAAKARRDTFLPIVLITNLQHITGGGSHLHGRISVTNFGHGIAFMVKAHIPGTGTLDLATKGIAAGKSRSQLVYDLPNSDILNNTLITITYNDIFGRHMKTLHEVNVVASYDNDRHLLQLKNVPPEINLP